MNASKILAVGILAGAALISTASAQTKIYITGSTAFRGVTNPQISALISGGPTIASSNSTLGSANAVTWTGGNIGGTAVTIKAAWTGSAGGIQSVARNNLAAAPTKFLVDGATGTGNLDPNDLLNPNPSFENAIPDVAMADNLQASTDFNGGVYAALTDTTVGVVSFTWAASKGFPLNGGTAPFANYSMSKKIAQQLLSQGAMPLAVFTGLDADNATTGHTPARVAYASGRNPDSGTRITTLAESGYGITSVVKQYQPTVTTATRSNSSITTGSPNVTVSSTAGLAVGQNVQATGIPNGATISSITNGTVFVMSANATATSATTKITITGPITALALYPTETINGISTNVDGNSGENTGGALRNYLIQTVDSGAFQYGETSSAFVVTYLGTSDFNSVSAGGAVALGWNGANVSVLGIQQGSYTFWGYERMMYRSTLGNGTTGGPAVKLSFATTLATNILGATPAALSPNVRLDTMIVGRAGDGGDISNGNF